MQEKREMLKAQIGIELDDDLLNHLNPYGEALDDVIRYMLEGHQKKTSSILKRKNFHTSPAIDAREISGLKQEYVDDFKKFWSQESEAADVILFDKFSMDYPDMMAHFLCYKYLGLVKISFEVGMSLAQLGNDVQPEARLNEFGEISFTEERTYPQQLGTKFGVGQAGEINREICRKIIEETLTERLNEYHNNQNKTIKVLGKAIHKINAINVGAEFVDCKKEAGLLRHHNTFQEKIDSIFHETTEAIKRHPASNKKILELQRRLGTAKNKKSEEIKKSYTRKLHEIKLSQKVIDATNRLRSLDVALKLFCTSSTTIQLEERYRELKQDIHNTAQAMRNEFIDFIGNGLNGFRDAWNDKTYQFWEDYETTVEEKQEELKTAFEEQFRKLKNSNEIHLHKACLEEATRKISEIDVKYKFENEKNSSNWEKLAQNLDTFVQEVGRNLARKRTRLLNINRRGSGSIGRRFNYNQHEELKPRLAEFKRAFVWKRTEIVFYDCMTRLNSLNISLTFSGCSTQPRLDAMYENTKAEIDELSAKVDNELGKILSSRLIGEEDIELVLEEKFFPFQVGYSEVLDTKYAEINQLVQQNRARIQFNKNNSDRASQNFPAEDMQGNQRQNGDLFFFNINNPDNNRRNDSNIHPNINNP